MGPTPACYKQGVSEASPRRYDTSTYAKHKRPTGWGALCPNELTEGDAQRLLESGVEIERAVYNVDGEHAFRAFEHEPGAWHGHPIPWSRLPNAARRELIARGRLDHATWRKAVRRGWGREHGA